MIIYHISGTPGSGKSYICANKKIKKKYKTIDSDYWIIEFDKKYSNILGRNARDAYEIFINNTIDKYHSKKDKYIICGILDKIFTINGKTLRPPKIIFPKTTKKIFIKIEIDKLFYQINNRTLHRLCLDKNDIENDLKNGNDKYLNRVISRFKSMDNLKNTLSHDIKFHKAIGYTLKTQKEIMIMLSK